MTEASEQSILNDVFDELFPIARSITGSGLRTSLAILSRYLPLRLIDTPTGTQVFDWIVPPEWVMRSARLIAPDGQVVADASRSNLEVVNYSEPVNRKLSLADLQPHLHSRSDLPQAIPYVTSYYKRAWGFCVPQTVRDELIDNGEYTALIDAEHVSGAVTVGDCILAGETEAEVLLSSYLCHPSMANNELSGPLVLLALYRRLARWPRRRFTYRFLLNPETIGSLCYLHRMADHLLRHVTAGLVLTCLGGPGSLTYKQSRRENSLLDLVVARSTEDLSIGLRPFTPLSGSDERQFCSPGFNLPIGQMARTVYGEYPEYHTSLDDKVFMTIPALIDAVDKIEAVLARLELSGRYRNLAPYGEPQLGKRNLYPTMNSHSTWSKSTDTVTDARLFLNTILTILSYSDGLTPMLTVADRLGVSLDEMRPAMETLESAGLLKLSETGTAA